MKYMHKGALIRRVSDEEAARLKTKGFKEMKVPEPETNQPEPEQSGSEKNDFQKMKKVELEAMAAEKGIEVPGRATKEDIVKLLEAAEDKEDHEE